MGAASRLGNAPACGNRTLHVIGIDAVVCRSGVHALAGASLKHPALGDQSIQTMFNLREEMGYSILTANIRVV